jgi:hypothetical protein
VFLKVTEVLVEVATHGTLPVSVEPQVLGGSGRGCLEDLPPVNVGSLVFLKVMEVMVEVATHRTLPVSVDLSLRILLPPLSHLQLKRIPQILCVPEVFLKKFVA